ncbi:MAG: branched-chain amino acid ABC transporter ATP-binding protein/permease [Candidatus Baltobacteraceae bacterium]
MRDRLRADARLLPFIAAAVAVFGVLLRGDANLMQAATFAAIDAVPAIGLSLLLGNVAQISLGQAGFFGIGAYTLGLLTTLGEPPGMPPWLAFALGTGAGTLLAAAFGLLLGVIALRFRGHYLAMATLAFGLIAAGVFRESPQLGGAGGIQNIPFPQLGPLTIAGGAAFWYAWAMVALAAWLATNLLRGQSGWAFEAIRNDELAAEAIGVPTRRYKIAAFTFAGGLAGFAGSFYSAYLGTIDPSAVGVSLSIDFLLMVVLGGAGGVAGAIMGATLIGVANVYGHELENWRPVIYGVLVIVVVVFFPNGLAGLVRRPRRRTGARVNGAAALARTQLSAPSAPAQAAEPACWLAVENVSKTFGGLVAVDGVSFALRSGTLSSLIGPNGAGKTTLFNAVCGIGKVDAGRVLVAGRDVTAWRPHRIAGLRVGRSFQNARLFGDMTVLENVAAGAFVLEGATIGADLFGLPASRRCVRAARERAAAVVASLGLEPLAGICAKDLAFGDRRRVELARALAAGPRLLLLDEPAAGLNAAERARLRDDLLALRARGLTLLLIEHDMRLVMEVSDRVMVLDFGRLIADGAPQAVREDPRVVAAYLGTASA